MIEVEVVLRPGAIYVAAGGDSWSRLRHETTHKIQSRAEQVD